MIKKTIFGQTSPLFKRLSLQRHLTPYVNHRRRRRNIQIHIHTHVHIHMHIRIYVQTHTHIHIHIYIYKFTHTVIYEKTNISHLCVEGLSL